MKILHTSDWHLGRSLYGRKRNEEFSLFLEWLNDTIVKENIDILLVAGDVFDTSTPSNRIQGQYYRFLCRVSGSGRCHVVIIGGNHDSPSFLNAPKELLKPMNVHIVGAKTEHPEDEVIVLSDEQRKPQAIVCAVPYLRDRDIRIVEPGESVEDKNTKLVEGLKNHYADVCAIAGEKQAELLENGHPCVPIIGMGHLFTAGGKTIEGDGVRELYVGSLAHVGVDVFPTSIDYLALGHLHLPQRVGHKDHIRYCGSPLPMGYGEARQEKKVNIVEFNSGSVSVQELPVPCFQVLERIVGSLDEVCARIDQLKRKESTAWLEIEYTGDDLVGSLRDLVDELLVDSAMEIRRIKDRRIIDRVLRAVQEGETLDDLDVHDVFRRCLETFEIADESRVELTRTYEEIIHSFHEEDPREL